MRAAVDLQMAGAVQPERRRHPVRSAHTDHAATDPDPVVQSERLRILTQTPSVQPCSIGGRGVAHDDPICGHDQFGVPPGGIRIGKPNRVPAAPPDRVPPDRQWDDRPGIRPGDHMGLQQGGGLGGTLRRLGGEGEDGALEQRWNPERLGLVERPPPLVELAFELTGPAEGRRQTGTDRRQRGSGRRLDEHVDAGVDVLRIKERQSKFHAGDCAREPRQSRPGLWITRPRRRACGQLHARTARISYAFPRDL